MPFSDSELTPCEFLIAFILYADTLLSITQIVALLSPCYTTLHDQLRELEAGFYPGFSDCLGAHRPDSRWADTGR
jgi:hypothetical protein